MIKNSIGRIDPLKVMVCAIGIVLVTLIVATCGLYMKVSDLSHDNEILVAQKETLQSVIVSRIDYHWTADGKLKLDAPQCDTGRFKYDPITGSIYDNETKSIYRKVETPFTNTVTVRLWNRTELVENDKCNFCHIGGNDDR